MHHIVSEIRQREDVDIKEVQTLLSQVWPTYIRDLRGYYNAYDTAQDSGWTGSPVDPPPMTVMMFHMWGGISRVLTGFSRALALACCILSFLDATTGGLPQQNLGGWLHSL